MLNLEPKLKTLGPQFHQPVMSAISPLLAPAMIVSSLTVIVTGTLMTLILRAGSLDTMLTSGWGTTIFVGTMATVGALAVGLGGLTPIGIQLGRLGEQLKGQPPSPDQIATLSRLGQRMGVLSRIDFVLVLIAFASMPLARYI